MGKVQRLSKPHRNMEGSRVQKFNKFLEKVGNFINYS